MIKTCVVGYDDGTVKVHYAIEHENKVWLVTAWLKNLAKGYATPERMIRIDALRQRIQVCEPGSKFDYANVILPKAVVEGISQDIEGFEVRSLPDSPRVDSRELKMLPTLF